MKILDCFSKNRKCIKDSLFIGNGNYYWNKKKAAWETKTEEQEGIPVRVEFQIYTGENDE